jgi:site-specific recombinase XerD
MDVFRDRKHNAIGGFIGEFLESLKALKYSPKSIGSYKQALCRFVSFLTAIDIARIADVTARDLAAYRLELIDQNYAGQSIGLYLRTVRKLFDYLEQTQRIFINPARSLIVPACKTPIKFVPTEDEVDNLLSRPDPSKPTGIRDRAVMETFYSTGARLEELTGMNVGDADLSQGRVKLTGKGGNRRVVPMGKQAVLWTDTYLKQVRPRFLRKRPDEPALWLGFQGRRINPLIVERFVRDYGKKAGIAVTPHALRRACATHMLRNGAHPVQIQMLLGHASLRTLSRYLNVTIADLTKTHAKAKPGK